MCYQNPLGEYFNVELKSIVMQHENLAAAGKAGLTLTRYSVNELLETFGLAEEQCCHSVVTEKF